MHVVIYFGIESKSQTANSDIDLQVCNLYLCRILNSKIKLPRGNVSIVAFFILKDSKVLSIRICQINIDNPDFSFSCRPSTFGLTVSDNFGSCSREQKGED